MRKAASAHLYSSMHVQQHVFGKHVAMNNEVHSTRRGAACKLRAERTVSRHRTLVPRCNYRMSEVKSWLMKGAQLANLLYFNWPGGAAGTVVVGLWRRRRSSAAQRQQRRRREQSVGAARGSKWVNATAEERAPSAAVVQRYPHREDTMSTCSTPSVVTLVVVVWCAAGALSSSTPAASAGSTTVTDGTAAETTALPATTREPDNDGADEDAVVSTTDTDSLTTVLGGADDPTTAEPRNGHSAQQTTGSVAAAEDSSTDGPLAKIAANISQVGCARIGRTLLSGGSPVARRKAAPRS